MRKVAMMAHSKMLRAPPLANASLALQLLVALRLRAAPRRVLDSSTTIIYMRRIDVATVASSRERPVSRSRPL